MLDAGSRQTELPGVMATSRGRPSVWYSAALWELNAVTSLGTPCTRNQGLHRVKGSFCLLYQQWTLFLQPAVPYERVIFFLSYTFSKSIIQCAIKLKQSEFAGLRVISS